MAERAINVREELTQGLRRVREAPRHEFSLSAVTGLVPYAGGLRAAETVTSIGGAYSGSWPLPHAFLGGRHIFILEAASLYVDGVAQTTYDVATPASGKAFSFTRQPHFCDMGDTWIITDGTTAIIKPNYDSTYFSYGTSYDEKAFVVTTPVPRTVTYHRGRAVYGGVSGSFFPWTASANKDEVIWSAIGGGDVFWPFVSSLVTTSSDLYNHYNKRNDHGFMYAQVGDIYAVKSLGKDLMVYGELGAAYLPQVATPAPGFGLVQLVAAPIASAGALCGSEQVHYFQDQEGYLWEARPGPEIKRLGYQEFLEGTSSHSFTFDRMLGHAYLGNSTKCYVLTPDGLGECSQHPVSVYRNASGVLTGSNFNTAGDVQFTLGPFNLRSPGVNQIMQVAVDYEDLTSPWVKLAYRYVGDGAYTTSSAVSLNDEGVAHLGLCGTDFKIIVGGTPSTNCRITALEIRYHTMDRRFRRGV